MRIARRSGARHRNNNTRIVDSLPRCSNNDTRVHLKKFWLPSVSREIHPKIIPHTRPTFRLGTRNTSFYKPALSERLLRRPRIRPRHLVAVVGTAMPTVAIITHARVPRSKFEVFGYGAFSLLLERRRPLPVARLHHFLSCPTSGNIHNGLYWAAPHRVTFRKPDASYAAARCQ